MKKYKYKDGFVKVLKDDRGNNFENVVSYIKRDTLYMVFINSEDKSISTFAEGLEGVEFEYIDIDLFTVFDSLNGYLSEMQVEASKYHLHHSEGQGMAFKSVDYYLFNKIMKESIKE